MGWMKKLEDAVIPAAGSMMHDLAIPLDAEQQQRLSLWAMKSAMVWEHLINLSAPIFYSDTERYQLRESSTMPSLTAVWLARYSGVNELYSQGIKLRTDASVNAVHGYTTTIAYRYLAIQILSIRVSKNEKRVAIVDPNPGPWGDATVRIWPTRRTIGWPPRLTLDGSSLSFDDFVERWSPTSRSRRPLVGF